MNERPENDRRPFADELSRSPYEREGKLFQLDTHPHVIIRFNRWADVSTKEKLAATIAEMNKNKALFSSLEKDGMRVAQTDYVIGGQKNAKGIAEGYAVVEKIDGKNLAQMDHFDARVAAEADQCYAGYMTHLLRILETGGRYWSDMGGSQIVYGTHEGDDVPHAYVVDVDPYVSSLPDKKEKENDPPKAAADFRRLLRELNFLCEEITRMEGKTENGVRMELTREKLHDIFVVLRPAIAENRTITSDERNNFSLLQEKLERVREKDSGQ